MYESNGTSIKEVGEGEMGGGEGVVRRVRESVS